MTVKEIREDLREIRYYYGMSDLFKAGSKLVPPKAIIEKVEKYMSAPALSEESKTQLEERRALLKKVVLDEIK